MIRIERQIDDAALTEALGRTLGRALRPGDVLELRGDLGTGKTTLVRGIAAGMGLDPGAVSSPTFVILHRYTQTPRAEAAPLALVHMDAYRLDEESGLDELGWDRAIEHAAVCVEWPERLGDRLAADLHARHGEGWQSHLGTVTLEHAGGDTRVLSIELPDDWAVRPAIDRLVTDPPRYCPRTGVAVAPDAPHYPFSSERARMADLHDWFAEGYAVSRPADAEDDETM